MPFERIDDKVKVTSDSKSVFSFVNDLTGSSTGWVAIKGPFRFKHEKEQYEEIKDFFRFFGMCGMKDWPNPEVDEWKRCHQEYDIPSIVEGWAHCFREPDNFIVDNTKPRMLISNSDFIDPYNNNIIKAINVPKMYDFVAFAHSNEWVADAKGWFLLKRILPVLCNDLGLKGILVGRRDVNDLRKCRNLEVSSYMKHSAFMQIVSSARFYLCASHLDASPRTLSESLCLDIPLLVNKNILGGWKYVNNSTGCFFSDEIDVKNAVDYVLNNTFSPRDYFCDNYGPENSGVNLARFIRKLDPSFSDSRLFLSKKTMIE